MSLSVKQGDGIMSVFLLKNQFVTICSIEAT